MVDTPITICNCSDSAPGLISSLICMTWRHRNGFKDLILFLGHLSVQTAKESQGMTNTGVRRLFLFSINEVGRAQSIYTNWAPLVQACSGIPVHINKHTACTGTFLVFTVLFRYIPRMYTYILKCNVYPAGGLLWAEKGHGYASVSWFQFECTYFVTLACGKWFWVCGKSKLWYSSHKTYISFNRYIPACTMYIPLHTTCTQFTKYSLRNIILWALTIGKIQGVQDMYEVVPKTWISALVHGKLVIFLVHTQYILVHTWYLPWNTSKYSVFNKCWYQGSRWWPSLQGDENSNYYYALAPDSGSLGPLGVCCQLRAEGDNSKTRTDATPSRRQ